MEEQFMDLQRILNTDHFDAVAFLSNYPIWKDRIAIIDRMLDRMVELGEDELIEQHVFLRKSFESIPNKMQQRDSKTENIALQLDDIKRQNTEEVNREKAELVEEKRILGLYIALYELAMNSLERDERKFIEVHFQKGYALRKIAKGEIPYSLRLSDTISMYRLQKMKEGIIRKVVQFLFLNVE